MANTTDPQLVAALDRLDEQWTGMSPARIRTLLRDDGFIVSEKRAKALKAEVLRSRAEDHTGSACTDPQPSMTSRDTCASCGAAAALHCSRCTRVKYCSKECQRAHWKAHRPSCAPRSTPSAAPRSAACPVCESQWASCHCEEGKKPSCWICLESNGTLLRGCACRGSAGYARMGACVCTRHVLAFMQVCTRVLHCGGEQAP
jgi:hypothetical protein